MWTPIIQPVPPALTRQLRRAVLEHARADTRRVFPPVLNIAATDGVGAQLPLLDHALDHALRTDLTEALCRRVRASTSGALVWISRTGELSVEDADLAWLAACRTAAAELDVTLRFVVINRRSWRDPASGAGCSWGRLR